jgi:transcriptional regulator GlxA family with amidase domain
MNNMVRPGTIHAVDIIVYPGFKALEAIGPLKVFDYANSHLAARGKGHGYQVCIAATQVGMVASDTIMSLQATKKITPLALPDLAIVVGAHQIEAALLRDAGIVEWVSAVKGRIARLAALCTGSFFLAEAGALNGKRATTHWAAAARFKERYPAVTVDADAIFVRAENIWTSAGVTAGIDLALAIVEEDFGRDLALEVARDLVVYLKRPGGQSQFSIYLSSQMTRHPKVRDLQDWILAHLAHDLSTPVLAQRLAMSERNLTRVFQRETTSTPAEFIETARFELARRLLEDNNTSLKLIAAKTGFGTEERMRRVFQRRLGITPRDYCERFSSTLRPETSHA